VSRILLDSGALIAVDRDRVDMRQRLTLAQRSGVPLVTHGGVVGQVWRHPSRQARLARLLRAIDIRPVDDSLGRRAGQLLAKSRMRDVIDAALVLLGEGGDRIFTSDPEDLAALVVAAGVDVEIVAI
jgi:predicted nucleic acid-binding protein